jgi:phage terminase large subunit-like protein
MRQWSTGYDLVDTATAARRQPLIIAIGTAGQEASDGILWYDLFKDAEAILAGTVQDDSTFAYITRPDERDDLDDERTWAKVNPAWDKTVKPDDLRRKHQKAKRLPRGMAAFRRLHLNVVGSEDSPWLDLRRWRKRACKLADNVLDVGDKLIKLSVAAKEGASFAG